MRPCPGLSSGAFSANQWAHNDHCDSNYRDQKYSSHGAATATTGTASSTAAACRTYGRTTKHMGQAHFA